METGTATANMNGARVHVVKVLIGQIAQRVTQKKRMTMNIQSMFESVIWIFIWGAFAILVFTVWAERNIK